MISAGGTFAAALKVAKQAEPGTSILAMLPDTGERYLSTPLFEDIPVEMDDAEIEISMSTPTMRGMRCSPNETPVLTGSLESW